MSVLPSIIAHADWGSDVRKRCVAVAYRHGDSYLIDVFDFPIGLPRAYADVAGVTDFVPFLRGLGTAEWANFYRVAQSPEDVSVARPFYPYRPGGTRQAHLTQGLGVPSIRALLRRCERGYETRGDACSLFWTLGPNQVGKAAISGWSEVLQPALLSQEGTMKIWPFDGELAELLRPGRCVVAETYPAEACTHLGLRAPGNEWSKRSQADRRQRALQVTREGAARAIRITPELRAVCDDGFGEGPDGEDAFDALIGLVAMIDVAEGRRAAGAPDDPAVRSVEGWILGQHPSSWS